MVLDAPLLDDDDFGMFAPSFISVELPGGRDLVAERLFDGDFESDGKLPADLDGENDREGDRDVPGGGVSVADGVSLAVGDRLPDGCLVTEMLLVAVNVPGEGVTDRVTVGVRVSELPFEGVMD
jgi:hypothetical protein